MFLCKRIFKAWLMIALFTVVSLTARGNESHDIYFSDTALTSAHFESVNLYSESLKQQRQVLISLPHNYIESASTIAYPLIVVMDAELLFHSVSGIAHLQAMNSQMPEAIVVGIPNAANKRRDMTPKPLNRNGEPLWFGGKENEYLTFLSDEVLPLLKKRFRVADFKVLVGLSPSANFALHTAWKNPNIFAGYIAINATNFAADGYGEQQVFDKIVASISKQQRKERFLFISMPSAGAQRRPGIVESYKNLDIKLKAQREKHIDFRWEVIDKKSYAAVLPAVTLGFEHIFPNEKWDPDYNRFVSEQPGATLNNIRSHFQELSEIYGFPALPKGERYYNRNRLKRIAYVFMNQGKYQEAEDIVLYWLSFYPNSANAHDTLADVYEAKG